MAAERENQTKGEGLTPAAAASKPSLSQLSSAPDFGIFGATQPAKPTNHGLSYFWLSLFSRTCNLPLGFSIWSFSIDHQ